MIASKELSTSLIIDKRINPINIGSVSNKFFNDLLALSIYFEVVAASSQEENK